MKLEVSFHQLDYVFLDRGFLHIGFNIIEEYGKRNIYYWHNKYRTTSQRISITLILMSNIYMKQSYKENVQVFDC